MSDTSRELRDPARLAALRHSKLLATGSNEVFDTLTRIVSRVLGVPISVLSVIDKDRQYFQGATGVLQSVRNSAPSDSFCATVVASCQPLIVGDARGHPLAHNNAAMEVLDIGAYAGVPVVTAGGQALGALAAISHTPRPWQEDEVGLLHELALLGRAELERRLADTRTRSARDELAAERALGIRFQAHLLNTVQQAVIATDPDGVIIFWNGYAETLYGWLAEDALGRHISELVVGEDGGSHWKEISSRMEANKPWTREQMLRRKDGSVFHALTTLSTMLDESGAREGIVGVSIDLTSQKNLEEQIRQSQKMEAVGRLTGGIAHDFNNLLTVIRLNADLVLEQLHPSGPHADDMRQILDSANRAASLTRQLLSFSRKEILQPRPVDMNKVTKSIEPILSRLVGEEVELELELGAKGRIVADSGQLDQILVNLVVNARDAMPGGGHVHIKTQNVALDGKYGGPTPEMPGNYIMLSVSDNGVGMSVETRVRAFDAFFTTKAAGSGTGLGLSTVYGIVKQSAGYVHLYSEPGLGTTVSVYFPKVEEGAAEAIVSTHHASPAKRGGETVLVVEDDDRLRGVARHILEDKGYAVLEAGDGREAMRMATDSPTPIDIVLTDMIMPGIAGGDLPDRMAAIRTDARFVFMSGHSRTDLIRRGMLLPNVPFLQKPFTAEQLADTIRDALDSPESTSYASSLTPALAASDTD
jgi:two-component system, cell cycle sensor histidine kinase and response regulator CckA